MSIQDTSPYLLGMLVLELRASHLLGKILYYPSAVFGLLLPILLGVIAIKSFLKPGS
jgi:hypothetical protein